MSFLEPVPPPKKQLDPRAWIIAGATVVVIAVASVIWVNRPKAGYTGRSLSATPHSAESQPVVKTLHVDGCHEDFLINPGESVEPRLAPGAPLEQFLTLYGPELAGKPLLQYGIPRQPDGTHQWNLELFRLAVLSKQQQPGENDRIQMSLNSGHVVESLDGVELGLDSFGTILRKMRDKKVEIHQRIRREESVDPDKPAHWVLTVSIYSACGKSFRSEYFRRIPSDPETDRQINPRVPALPGQFVPLRSDVFMNKVVYDYILQDSNGSDDNPKAGDLAERE
jgi:hypothetical protein